MAKKVFISGPIIGMEKQQDYRKTITDITSKLGGASINDIDYFREKGPTAENVATYIFQRLEPNLPDGVRLESVSVSEQVGCSAKYRAG